MKAIFPLLIMTLVACGGPVKQRKHAATSKQQLSTSSMDSDPLARPLKASFASMDKTYIIQAEKAEIIETPKGTRISFHANSFVNAAGIPIKGKIKIHFAEFQSEGEILASKIPMVYTDPEGNKQQFQSAGMFEIRAEQNGKELELASGKKARVELSSSQDGQFNFYSFDEQKNNWELKSKDCLPKNDQLNEEEQARLNELKNLKPETKPKKPITYKKGDRLFDLRADPHRFPELSPVIGVLWKYTGKEAKLDPADNPEIFQHNYEYLSMEPLEGENLEYLMTFRSAKDTVKIQAAPIFKGKLLDRKNKEMAAKIAKMNADLAEKARLEKQLERENLLLRSFDLDKLGIYNYDRQWKDEEAIPLNAIFAFEGGMSKDDQANTNVFLIPREKGVVVRYTPETFANFMLNPNEYNRLLAISPDNRIFVLSNAEIMQLNIKPSMADQKFTFELKELKKANSASAIDQILASL